jgi:DNA-binding transcriptional MerR regulator
VSGSRELIKLYYRIGEVAHIVGVEPHVLRYWETEFRSIRPQKSSKGQRVYSRRDVEKLLRVKDLLKNQGFTIAGARKRLSEAAPTPAESATAESATATAAPAAAVEAVGAAETPENETGAKSMRKALLGLRHDLLRMLEELTEPKER